MIVLVQDKGPIKSDPPHLAEAIKIIRNLWGPENVFFDLHFQPRQQPVLMAYHVDNGVEKLLGPVMSLTHTS